MHRTCIVNGINFYHGVASSSNTIYKSIEVCSNMMNLHNNIFSFKKDKLKWAKWKVIQKFAILMQLAKNVTWSHINTQTALNCTTTINSREKKPADNI